MNTPPYLKPGNTVGVVATARKITMEEIKPAVNILQQWGLKPLIGNTIGMVDNQFAGTDYDRAHDLQSMLDNPEIKAIICARGGYGTVRIVDKLDFSSFQKHPKWLCGFSDVTVLHSHINQYLNITTLHSPMCYNFVKDGQINISIDYLHTALFGNELNYQIASHPLNRNGVAEGEITGGNLSILYSLAGTLSDINTEDKILFLEDLDEYLYHVDRMMMNLKRAGKLDKLKGLVVGGMTDMKDNAVPFGKYAEEIILDAVREFQYPVCFGFPAGHVADNRTLIMGGRAILEVKDNVTLKFV